MELTVGMANFLHGKRVIGMDLASTTLPPRASPPGERWRQRTRDILKLTEVVQEL